MALADERPTIIINRDGSMDDAQLVEVLLGIEEEGIPYVLQAKASSDVNHLAHEAALESRLGVGIGATRTEVAVSTEKLPLVANK